jgi:hypothetical protein
LPAHAAETRMSVRQEGNLLTIEGQLDVPVNPNHRLGSS